MTAEPSAAAVVAVHVRSRPERFLPTIRALRAHAPELPLLVGAPDVEMLDRFVDLGLPTRVSATPGALANAAWTEHRAHVLMVSEPVLVPERFLDAALEAVERDLRVATVSFLSNWADFLSFPYGGAVHRAPEGNDETTVTRRLRTLAPVEPPVPIAYAAGAAVLLSAAAIGAVGPLRDAPSQSGPAAAAEFSLRARRRGFLSLLDPTTFVTRPSDLADGPLADDITPLDVAWLDGEHPFGRPLLAAELGSGESPMSIALTAARAKVLGIRVLIDGSVLGPSQMGTQTTILALIDALARRDDVAEVGVVLGSDPPGYARASLQRPKVNARACPADDLSVFGRVDIGHRPFQPDQRFVPDAWQAACDRFVVTILDLIGYQIGSYYTSPDVWMEYREILRRSVARADGVTVISTDVREQVELERLSIDPDRLFAVHYGTEHLLGDEPARVPAELVARGQMASQFLLCLGTNYSHKNRDLAIRVHNELRTRGWDLSLVLAGAFVPFGSSRVAESIDTPFGDESVVMLPDINDEERNWLLRHASLVLYPTSAEGFGLVPFEAARFGTATVAVSFGPLLELGGDDLPAATTSWDPGDLADTAERLLADPALAEAQVKAYLTKGTGYTWDRTASELTALYRRLLSMPPRWPEGMQR